MMWSVPQTHFILSTASKVFNVLIVFSKCIFQCCGYGMIYFISGWEEQQTSQGQIPPKCDIFKKKLSKFFSWKDLVMIKMWLLSIWVLDPDPSFISDPISIDNVVEINFWIPLRNKPPCCYWNIPNCRCPWPNYHWLKQVASAPVLFSFFSCWPVFFYSVYDFFYYKILNLFFLQISLYRK